MFNHYELQEQLLSTTFSVQCVPASRPRVTRNGKVYHDKPYNQFKAWLSAELQRRYPYLVLAPGTTKENLYRVNWSALNPSPNADRDNLDKAILDSLQEAGIISNDNLVRDGILQMVYKTGEDSLLHLEVYTLKQLH